jgi:hypothetical protein
MKTLGVGREVKHVVQVGAATLIPKIKKMLSDYFNRGINRFVDPEVSVAYGASGGGEMMIGSPELAIAKNHVSFNFQICFCFFFYSMYFCLLHIFTYICYVDHGYFDFIF